MAKKKMTRETINKQLKLKDLNISLSCLRILQPADMERIYQSLRRLGQLNPIIVRKEGNNYQILDGFKRYFGAERIGWPCLDARVLDISISHGVAMMLNYNRTNRSLMDYDEALVVYSLKKDHLMDQSSISQLTGYSRSWVCRRLALIEKLAFSVQQELRMGMISNSQARAIVKLPRGNQEDIMRGVISHGITSRDCSVLVEKFLQSNSKSEQEYIINHPVEVIEQSSHKDELYNHGLAWHGNRLFNSIERLIALQNTFIAQFTHHHTRELKEIELSMLPGKLEMVEKNASTILSIIKNKTLIQ